MPAALHVLIWKLNTETVGLECAHTATDAFISDYWLTTDLRFRSWGKRLAQRGRKWYWCVVAWLTGNRCVKPEPRLVCASAQRAVTDCGLDETFQGCSFSCLLIRGADEDLVPLWNTFCVFEFCSFIHVWGVIFNLLSIDSIISLIRLSGVFFFFITTICPDRGWSKTSNCKECLWHVYSEYTWKPCLYWPRVVGVVAHSYTQLIS